MSRGDVRGGAADLARRTGCTVLTAEDQWPRLTEREWDLLEYLKDGFRMVDIANHLGWRRTSVSRYFLRMQKKLEARSTVHIVSRAYELGLLVVVNGEGQRNPATLAPRRAS